jgi:hypothetical protein
MGPVRYFPSGANVKIQEGMVKLSGKALVDAAGDANTILVVTGRLFITSPVEKVGYRQLIVAGQMLAPKASEDMLGPYLEVQGQILWYAGTPRIFDGDDRFSAAFFELLKEPIMLIINGHAVVESDVTVDLLRAKVTEIILNGALEGPKHLIPLLQVLTTEKNGTIQVEGEGS